MATPSLSQQSWFGSRIAVDLNATKSQLLDMLEGLGPQCASVDIRYQAPPNGVIVPEHVDTLYDEVVVEQQQQQQQQQPHEHRDGGDQHAGAVKQEDVHDHDSRTGSLHSPISVVSRETPAQRKLRRKQRKCRQRRLLLEGKLWFVLGLLRDAAPHLKHVSIRLVGGTCPAEALAWLLNKADRLESFHIRSALHGDIPQLAQALGRHSTLTKVWLDHCQPYNYGAWEGENGNTTTKLRHPSLEPIMLEGLAQCQSLRELTMSQCHMILPTKRHLAEQEDLLEAPTWESAGQALSHLVTTSKSLKKLSLDAMRGVTDAGLAMLAQSLEGSSHCQLRGLSIRQCNVGPKTGGALGRMLTHNSTLQTLDVNIQCFEALLQDQNTGEFQALCHEGDPAAIVQGLRYNGTLQCLGLYCDTLFSKHPDIVGNTIEHRANELCQQAQEATSKIFQPDPLASSGEFNCVLKNLIIGNRDRELSPEIDFYLKWNGAGRDFLRKHEDVTVNEWLYSIIRCSDLSVTYALIGMNPTMLALGSSLA